MKTRITRIVLTLAVLVATASPSRAQTSTLPAAATHDRIQDRSYHFDEAERDIPYALYVPTTYDEATPAPLIVLLHGLGSSPDRVIRYEGLTDLAEERGYIVVAPMGYNSRGWYGSRGTGRASERGDAANDPDNLGELSEKDVLNVLRRTLDEFNIDREQVFLAGHSMGGGGTWHLAIEYPEMFAALAPVAPAIYSSPHQLEVIRDVPVIVIQGDADALVSVGVTREWVATMKKLGMDYRYIEVPGGDHVEVITRTPDHVKAIFDFFDEVRGSR